MTNRPLILGVVAALWMSGGQANAQSACPTGVGNFLTIGEIVATPGFSCTNGSVTYSHFVFSTGATFFQTEVFFGNDGSVNGAQYDLFFLPGPNGFPAGERMFGFTASINPSATAGTEFSEYTFLSTAPQPNPVVTYNAAVMGNNSGDHDFTLEITASTPVLTAEKTLTFAPADTSDVVTFTVNPLAALNGPTVFNSGSIFNTLQLAVPAAVPEPISLSLFSIGLAGIGFMRRRKAG